jgi:signal transduction histidine kinase
MHRKRMRFLLFISLFLVALVTRSQSEMNFYVNDQLNRFPQGTLFWIDSTESFEPTIFFENETRALTALPTEISNLNGKIWLSIPLDSNTTKYCPYAVITNPHINFIRAWWLDDQKNILKSSLITGDHAAFKSREITSPSFTFQNTNTRECKFLLLCVDKRNEVLTLNIHLANIDFIEKRLAQETVLFGWLIGIVAIMFIITLVLFFFVKDKIYLYSVGFLFFMLTYSIADFGFLHWFLTFETPKNLDSVRPASLAISMIFYILFITHALQFKENIPRTYKFLKIISFCFIGYILLAFALYSISKSEFIRYYGVLISHYFQRGLLTILIAGVVQSALLKKPYAILISSSLFLFLTVHFVNHYYENGTLPDELIFQHFLPIIYTVDCLVMSIIIARTFLKFQKNSVNLSQELLQRNFEYNNKLNEVKEKDLTRISQYLHDNIGAEISSMRYDLEALKNNPNPAEALNRIIEKSSHIADEVRNASHNLSPLMLERFGLRESIGQFLTQINKSSTCNYQLDVIGDTESIDKNLKIILFQIIQESIQNILKHAKAENAIIQIMLAESSIQLFIEDDGIGCSLETIQHGLGLDSIKQLLELKKGVFQMNSEPNKGMKIYAELPL